MNRKIEIDFGGLALVIFMTFFLSYLLLPTIVKDTTKAYFEAVDDRGWKPIPETKASPEPKKEDSVKNQGEKNG